MTVTIPKIISVDDHVLEPPDLWQRWLPARFRDAGPRVVRAPWEPTKKAQPDGTGVLRRTVSRHQMASSGPETDFWVYEDLAVAIGKHVAVAGLAAEEVDNDPIAFDEMRPGCYDARARLDDMDLNHTERSLCFPTFPRFCGQTFLEAKNRQLALACVKAYNDWMVDEWAGESGGRLIPLCLVPLWDVDLAAREVRRNADRGVHAVVFSEGPDMLGLPAIYDVDYWTPFLTACSETGTTVCIHIGSSSHPIARPNMASNYSLTHLSSEIALVDWFLSGALVRFPTLKLALSESQVGWMPFVFWRMDSVWEKQRERPIAGQFLREIVEPPSSYLNDRVFGCAFEDDLGLASRGAPLGIDSLTFETDYPHTDSTWPNTKAYAEKALATYTQDEVNKVIRTNAIRMLELPADIS
jgi:predicted TIM-barrel fold metal-dependent hydrolase